MNETNLLGNLRGDLFGGVTAGIIALPLALAFGVASGLGAQAGLYGAIVLGFISALLGGTRTQISGPTGPMTVITAACLTAFGGDVGKVMAVILLAGLFQIVFGIIRAGTLVRFIPYPVVSGFMNGIGIIIIILQANPLVGTDAYGSPLVTVAHLPETLLHVSYHSLLVGGIAMAIVFLTPMRVSRVIPSPLIALIIGTVLSVVAGLDVKTIGEIPTTLPHLSFPAFSIHDFGMVVMFALSLGLLGSIDTLLTSLVADSVTMTRHNSNRELIGQGLGNMAVSIVGGIGGAGATMRTVINIKSGGKTRLSGAIHALFLLLLLLGAAPLATNIPLAVLAGILVKVGADILDYKFIGLIKSAPKEDLAVMIVVFILTVFADLIVAVGVGIVLASLILTFRVARQTRLQIYGVGIDRETEEASEEIRTESNYRIRVISITGPFFFGSTSQIVDKADRLLGTEVIVFNTLAVPFVDISAVFALEETIRKLAAAGIVSLIVATEAIKNELLKLGVDVVAGRENIFVDEAQAVDRAKELIGQ